MGYRIEAHFVAAPAGYSVSDYFRDRGACLEREYATEDEASATLQAQYLGPDADGVTPVVEVVAA